MKDFMSKSEYARHRKVVPSMVTKWIQEEKIIVNENGRVNVELSDILLDNNSQTHYDFDSDSELHPGLLKNIQSGSYAEQRTRLTKYKAELAKIELDKANGDLVEAVPMYKEAFDPARQLRDNLLSIPDRMSGPLASETDQLKVHNMLSEELNNIFKEFSEKLRSKHKVFQDL